ncbi:MAG: SDR family oxidoreductase [Gemmataceae bacterium]|nr:SDR family oxidoreductase [Gemmataceae bacterium]MDW8264087.1 SDR family oxidoreductase [Gemmataceae bacterium]
MGVLERFRLDGKRALITGGSRGLGLAMASALAEAGADLVLVGREVQALQASGQQLERFGRRVDLLPADLETPEGTERMCQEALARFSPIHILINNVGGRRINIPTEQMPLAEWQRILNLNLTSAFLCCKLIGGAMLPRRSGRIINVASISGMIVNKGIHGRSYETAKAGLIGFTKALAVDWVPYNVTVNAIAAGGFMTDPNRRWFQQMPELKTTFESMVPMGRLGEPEEIGPLALYLASDASSYMTGAAVVIDGGYTLW